MVDGFDLNVLESTPGAIRAGRTAPDHSHSIVPGGFEVTS